MEVVEVLVVVQHQFGENKMNTELWWRKVGERLLQDLSIDLKMQLKRIKRNRMGERGLDPCDLGQ